MEPRHAGTAPWQEPSGGLLRAIVENSTDIIAVLDAEARLVYVSPSASRLLGYQAEEWAGSEVLSLIHPDDVERVRGYLAQMLATPGEAPAREFRLVTWSGDSRYVESHGTNLLGDPEVRGVILNLRDVSERRHVDRALRTLGDGNQALVRSTDEVSLLNHMCRTVVDTGGYRLAWVGYVEDDPEKTVRPMASAGAVEYLRNIRVSWGDDEHGRGPTGMAIRTGRPQVIHDLRVSAAFRPWREQALSFGFRTSLVLPMTMDGRILGTLSIYSDEVGAFDPPSVRLLTDLADDLIYGVARVRHAAHLGRSLAATIGALTAMSEIRDLYTAGHQCRVGALSAAIATDLGIGDDLVTWIRVAGELHDIGKIAVPIEILSRPAALTAAEMALVRGHPRAGFDILRGIDFPGQVADMVLQHHERMDGSGYPQGLRGDQILLGSRILAVSDTVEAMSNHRPYRPALGIDLALAEVTDGAGSRYDADVVASCVRLFESGFSFAAESVPPMTAGWVPLGMIHTPSDLDLSTVVGGPV